MSLSDKNNYNIKIETKQQLKEAIQENCKNYFESQKEDVEWNKVMSIQTKIQIAQILAEVAGDITSTLRDTTPIKHRKSGSKKQ